VTQRQQDVVQAESNLRQARANTQQLEVRQDEVRAARATVEQARAALAVARQAIADATIRSPIDGLISTRGTEPGQQAAPGSTVATIVALDTVYFEAKVPDTDIAALAAGQSVGVTIDAFPGRKFQGRIARIEPAGDNASRTFNVRVEIPNSGAALRPGLFARGEVVAERRQNVVTVPTEALLRPTGGETGAAAEQIRIFTVQDGVAREAKVETGLSSPDGLRVEVTGVPANSQVVVSGQRGIKDGDKVTAEPVNGAGASGAGAQQTASR